MLNKKLLFETDWLASTPVFLDIVNGNASTRIQSMMQNVKLSAFHPEGLYNFLDFGYSVFGQTPLKNLCFLRHSCRLWQTEAGTLEVEKMDDPFERYESYRLSESDVVGLIRERVQAWEAALPSDQEIVLPLSGGFDSRLLLWCLREPSRVRAYTYGISSNQGNSSEVVYAKALAEKFGVRWEQIPLGSFHRYFDDWDSEYGLSTHAHGMYHYEFYDKIREKLQGDHVLLSGIIGDAWAGSIHPVKLENSQDLVLLGYTHGLRANANKIQMPTEHELREEFWRENREKLRDHRFQIVTSMRLKLMLLSYLIRVPMSFSFTPWAPYLDIDIAMAMLNLPQKRRINRQWQRDFFKKNGLYLENLGLKSSRANNLDVQAIKRIPLVPLNRELLSSLVDSDYIDWVNRTVNLNFIRQWDFAICSTPKVGRVLRALQLCKCSILEAYYAYVCLKPLQAVLDRDFNKSKRHDE